MGLQKRGEEWEEYDHAVQWMSLTVIITLLVTIFLAVISMPLGYVIGNGISKESMDNVGKFMGMIFNDPSYLFSRYWNWMRQIGNYHGPFSFSLWLPVLPILSLPIGLIIGAVTNPYRFQSNIHGSGRIATLKDIKAMKLLDGFCMVIGKFKGYYLKLPETLSTLCCAPPGTGKTAGVVIPTIFNSKGLSLVINDPKPELCFTTSGARANDYFIGRVYEGKLDEEDKQVLEGYYEDIKMHNPAAVRAISDLRNNNLTVENYVPIGTWDLLPEKWVGREACIAMIMEWLTEAQIKQGQEIKRRLAEGDQMAAMADPMRDLLDAAIEESRKYGYSQRAYTELSTLSNMPDKERGSVMSTAFAGIGVFKNSAVVSRTSFSDLQFKDLRGMKDPITGEWKPISVYLSINQVDARALGVISGIFIELMSSYLISNPPNYVNATDGKMGPFPALFVLDEFPQMPKLKAVIDGPAVGRGQKVSYLLIGQDLGQISGKYGKDDLETVISTTACKVILSQNNEQTAQRFSKMVGNKTVQTSSYSKQEGFSKQANPFSKNVNYQLQGVSVITTSQLLSLPMLKQVVLYQSYIDRPIIADSPRYYLDPKMRALSKLPAAPNVPEWIVAQREDINDNMLEKLGLGEEEA